MPRSDNFQLGLLPERHINWRTLAASYGAIVLLLLLSISVGFLFPDELRFRQKFTVTELVPRPDLEPKPVAQKKAPRHELVAKLKPVVPVLAAKLFVPKELARPKKKEEEKEAPKLETTFAAPVLQPASNLPTKVIYTGSFGSSAPATVSAAIQQVQTGGFGDPNGLKGQGKEGAHLTATQVGSFDMPSGPGVGNGTGGAKGIRGTIASAGFGNGIALGNNNGGGHGSVQTSGFGSQEVTHTSAKAMQADTVAATSQVEILFKPHPVYTDEARALKLEGEVLLEVLFSAAGQLHVNRVVRGLGHGLDEAAIAAANKMRFKPAMQNGSPVDSTAIVHVVFQLAY
jgi:TonB family protein